MSPHEGGGGWPGGVGGIPPHPLGALGSLFGDGTYSQNIIQGGSVLQPQESYVGYLSNIATTGTASASSYYSASYLPAYAIDGDTTQSGGWQSATVCPQWLRVTLPAAKAVGKYNIILSNSAAFAPSTWELQGSNDDGATWTTLDTRSGQTFSNGVMNYYTIPTANVGAYKDYRLYITVGGSNPAYPYLTELQLIEAVVATNAIVVTGAATVAPDAVTNCAFAQGSTLVLDGATAAINPSTYCRGLFLAFDRVVFLNGAKASMTGLGFPGQVTGEISLYDLIPSAYQRKFKSTLKRYILSNDGAAGGLGVAGGNGQTGANAVGKTGGGGGGGCDNYSPGAPGGDGSYGTCFCGGSAGGGGPSWADPDTAGDAAPYGGQGGVGGSGPTWKGGGGAGRPAGASGGSDAAAGSLGAGGLLVILARSLEGSTGTVENKGMAGGRSNTTGYAGPGGGSGGGLTYLLTNTDTFAGTVTCAGGLRGASGATRSSLAGDGGVGSIIRQSGLE